LATTATIAELFGRDEELSQLHGLVDNAKRTGGALLLVGEPGIGKTALLGSTIARANELGLRVLSTTGVQSEANLPFAGLHQLVRPILGHAEALPPPQRRALLSAFGELEEPVQNVFLVGLATLGLLTEASTDAPLLVTVDDVQWLDSPSCGALAFVARRLGADHIVFVAALRAGLLGPLTEAGISELRIGPLDDASAERLFEARGSGVPSSMRERVLRAAEGNPLALIDLPSALESFHGEAVGSPPDLLPVTMRLEAAYAARAQGLPATARRLLLIAAVNDSDQIAEAVAAANLLSKETMTADGFAPAEAADLLDLDGARIRFRHPLVRSAMYQKAPSSERRAIHAALATALDREPDRQAWHRAAAVIGPDDGVAKELDRAALRAERRGAIAVAAAALERAAELTTDETDKGARLLRAIHLEFQLGRPGEVTRLMGLAAHLDLAAHDRFMLAGFTAMFDPGIPGDPTLARSMVAAATRAIAEGESDIALDLLRVAAVRAWWADPGDDARAALLDAAKELRVVDDDPRRATLSASSRSRTRCGMERRSSTPSNGWLHSWLTMRLRSGISRNPLRLSATSAVRRCCTRAPFQLSALRAGLDSSRPRSPRKRGFRSTWVSGGQPSPQRKRVPAWPRRPDNPSGSHRPSRHRPFLPDCAGMPQLHPPSRPKPSASPGQRGRRGPWGIAC
jgi:hypothetical protein